MSSTATLADFDWKKPTNPKNPNPPIFPGLFPCGQCDWCTCSADDPPLLSFSQLLLLLLLLGCWGGRRHLTAGCQHLQQQEIISHSNIHKELSGVVQLRLKTLILKSEWWNILTTLVTTGLWFSIRASWFSLAHSNRVYIIAVPRLASTCSSSCNRISCFVAAELLLNQRKWKKQHEHHMEHVLVI